MELQPYENRDPVWSRPGYHRIRKGADLLTLPTLATALDEIMDGFLDALKAENVPGGLLSEVVTIARGDRTGPRADAPAVYITPRPMTAVQGTTTREWWTLPVLAGSMVQSDNDPDGYYNATDIAARVRRIMLKRLNLMYTKKPYSGEFTPAAPGMREEDYFRAMAEIRIQFEVEEKT